jgi:streptogramin lyase
VKLILLLAVLGLAALLAACTPAPPPGFSLSLEPAAGSATPGSRTSTIATITPVHGFTGLVTLSLVNPPAGITLSGGAADLTGPDPVTVSMGIAVTAEAVLAEHQLRVAAVSGNLRHTATFTLSVTAPPPSPSFTLSLEPAAGSATPGSSTSTIATITPQHGFTGIVNFSLVNPPAGINLSGGAAVLTSAAAVTTPVTVALASGVGLGEHRLTVAAVSGSLWQTASFTLTVTSTPPPASFLLNLNPSSLTVAQGSSGTATLTLTPQHGFTGGVTLSLIGEPAGVTLSPLSLNVTGTAPIDQVLRISADSTALIGNYPIQVRAVAEGISRHAALSLSVTAPQIYVLDRFNDRIVRMDDMAGTGWTSFGTRGTGHNQFTWPTSVFVDGAGRIYVADFLNHRIVRMDDMAGTGWTSFGTFGRGSNQFYWPFGIFVDGAGRIYVGDRGNHRIVRMDDMAGAGWTSFGTGGTGTNQFIFPDGVFVDGAGRIYVVDQGNSRIVRMDDMAGTGWTSFGTFGTGPNQFQRPTNVFVDGAGRIYVADSGNHRIVRMDNMAGAGWTSFGTEGTGPNQFNWPRSVFVDGAGRIYVADTDNHRIVRMDDMAGTGWTTFGAYGSGLNQFRGPNGIFIR